MKSRKNELDVDFIGGEGSLTEEEKKALNDYFNSKKSKELKIHSVLPKRIAKRGKSIV